MLLSPRLTALLDVASLQDITEMHLRALVDAQVGEDQDLDFKRTCYESGPEGSGEIGKDAAALANLVGGLIVLGIAEDDQGRASALTPVQLDDSQKGRIRQALAERVSPMIAGLDVHAVPSLSDPALGYYLIYVPRSTLAPHAVRHKNLKPLNYSFPLRHGTTTHYMSEAEIAARYRDRFALAVEQVDRLERIHKDGSRRTGQVDGVAVAVGLVPTLPGNRSITGEQATISRFLENWQSPLAHLRGDAFRNQTVARRRVRTENSIGTVELHCDGAGWALMIVGNTSVQVPGMENVIVQMVRLLGSYAAWSGAAGDCILSARFYGAARHVKWLDHGGVVINESHPVAEPAEATAPIEAFTNGTDGPGQVAYPLIRDLEQDMGIPEPVILQADGSILYRTP